MIGPIENQPVRLDRNEGTNRPAGEGKDAATQPRRADRVEISTEAREKAAQLQVEGLSPERVAEIRQRLADGTYNSPEVIDEVARQIIERGDV